MAGGFRRLVLAATVLVGAYFGLVATSGPPAGAVTLREQIVGVATSELNNGSRNYEVGDNCTYYNGYWGDGSAGCGPAGWRGPVAWCANFARYVWRIAGVTTLTRLDAWAYSFAKYGAAQGTLHLAGSGYSPRPGDAVVFDWDSPYLNLAGIAGMSHAQATDIDHVGIVTGYSGGTVSTIEGNSSDRVRARSYSYSNPELRGYISPVGADTAPPAATGPGVVDRVGGDYNGDGRQDVAALYDYGGGHVAVWVWYQAGTGTAAPTLAWDGPTWGAAANTRVQTGDFNGDTRTDVLLMYDYGGGHVALWYLVGRSNGTFEGPVLGWDGPTWGSVANTRVLTGDFSGDGAADVALFYDYGGNHVAIWTIRGTAGTASGRFAEPVLAWDGPTWGSGANTRVLTGDFNGDETADVGLFYDYGGNHVAIWTALGQAGGWLADPVLAWDGPTWGAGANTRLVTGDVTGDGRTDVSLFFDYGGGHVALWNLPATAPGTFGAAVLAWDGPTWGPAANTRVAAGDVTGDGKSDVSLFFDYGGGHVALWNLPGTASGAFGTAVRGWDGPTWGSGASTQLLTGDLGGDGKSDVLLFFDYGGGHVGLFRLPGTAGGAFGAAALVWDGPTWGAAANTRLF